MGEPILSTYADFADMLGDLPLILRSARRMRGLSLRAAAQEIGVNFNTVGRVENGTECDTGTLVAILRWLDEPTRAAAQTNHDTDLVCRGAGLLPTKGATP